MNPDILLDIESEPVILHVLNSGDEIKFTSSLSTKPTDGTGKSVEWETLKYTIDKTNEQREKHRQNRNNQKGEKKDVDYLYDVHISEHTVRISIINHKNYPHCFIVPFYKCEKL